MHRIAQKREARIDSLSISDASLAFVITLSDSVSLRGSPRGLAAESRTSLASTRSSGSMSHYGDHLSLQQTMIRDARTLIDGVKAALRFKPLVERIRDDQKTQGQLIRSALVQAVVLLSVLVLDYLLLPSLARKGVEHDRQQAVAAYYQMFWLYPILGASFLFAGYAQRSSSSGSSSQHEGGVIARVVAESYRGCVTTLPCSPPSLVLVQCFAISFLLYRIPLIGRILSLLYLSLTNSLYVPDPRR